jgi:hypothetical protein
MKVNLWTLHPNGSAYRKIASFNSVEDAKAEKREAMIAGFDVLVLPENENPPEVYRNPRK